MQKRQELETGSIFKTCCIAKSTNHSASQGAGAPKHIWKKAFENQDFCHKRNNQSHSNICTKDTDELFSSY